MYVIIPARMGSERLPGKPLLDIAGKPMMQHVFERGVEALEARDKVFLAVDSGELMKTAKDKGLNVIMTRDDHVSGTDRLAEAAEILELPEDAIVVNVQGDEPMMPTSLIREVGALLEADETVGMASVGAEMSDPDEIQDPNIVKLVMGSDQCALYFSRSPIPFDRDAGAAQSAIRHLGLYAYQVGTLKRLTSLPPSPLEIREKLEQLRALENGIRIKIHVTDELPPHGVDTPEDLQRVRKMMKA